MATLRCRHCCSRAWDWAINVGSGFGEAATVVVSGAEVRSVGMASGSPHRVATSTATPATVAAMASAGVDRRRR